MIVLDTNVVSEPMRARGHPAVTAWLDRQVAETLFLTATSLSELLLGIEVLQAGRRRKELATGLRALIGSLFGERVLGFDAAAAAVYATLVARARAGGIAVSVGDGQIGAIAARHGFAVATRDRGPFAAMGLLVIDPWTEAG